MIGGTGTPGEASARLTVKAGNGNQLALDNNSEQFTQLNFDHNSTGPFTFIALDKTNEDFVIGAQVSYAAFRNIVFKPDSATSLMVWTRTNKVGIGITIPIHLLHIRAFSCPTDVAIDTFGATDNSRLLFKRENSERWAFDYEGSTDNLRIQYGGVTKATFLNNTGYFGLNTSSPTQIVSRFTIYGLNTSEEARWVRDAGIFGTNEGIIRADSNTFIIDTTGQLGAQTDLRLATQGTGYLFIDNSAG